MSQPCLLRKVALCCIAAFATLAPIQLFAEAPTLDKISLQKQIDLFAPSTLLDLRCQCATAHASGQPLSYATIDDDYSVDALDEAISACGGFQGKYAELGYQHFEAVTSCGLVVQTTAAAKSPNPLKQTALLARNPALVELFSHITDATTECTCAVTGTDVAGKPATRFEKYDKAMSYYNLDGATQVCARPASYRLHQDGQHKAISHCGVRVVSAKQKWQENFPYYQAAVNAPKSDLDVFGNPVGDPTAWDAPCAKGRAIASCTPYNFSDTALVCPDLKTGQTVVPASAPANSHRPGTGSYIDKNGHVQYRVCSWLPIPDGEDPSDPANPVNLRQEVESSDSNDNAGDGDTGVDWHGKTGGISYVPNSSNSSNTVSVDRHNHNPSTCSKCRPKGDADPADHANDDHNPATCSQCKFEARQATVEAARGSSGKKDVP